MSKPTVEQRRVPISALRLDPTNPRLPDSFKGGSQSELAVVLEMGFEAFAVAQSIADHGFFLGEPLLVIDGSSEGEAGAWIVVEGNRRLTALLGLTRPDIRAEFAEPERWESVAARCTLTGGDEVPVVVHPDRLSTHVEVAKAHVIGKLPWRPFMQARFIAARVAEGKSFEDVSSLIGITKSKAADLYRDQAVVTQAQAMGLDTGEIEGAFSLLTVAMGNTKLRDHVGAPLGSRLEPGTDPIPAEKVTELKELISWVFGDEDDEPKISDSRQMSLLGNVVSSDVGLAALRDGASLEEANQKVKAAGLDPRTRLLNRLTTAKSSMLSAGDDLAGYADDPQVEALVFDIEAAADSLRNTITEVSALTEANG